MSDYSNSFGGAAKDAANATILAADHDTEYDGIATMSATKANKVSGGTTDNIATLTATGDIQDGGSAIADITSNAYPVGAIFLSAVATDPSTLLGFGTWSAIGEGRVLVGAGAGAGLTARTAGDTFGSEDAVVVEHNHAVTDAGHAHTVSYDANDNNSGGSDRGGTGSGTFNTGSATTGITIDNAGVSGTGANMQPSLVVYMWQRTA